MPNVKITGTDKLAKVDARFLKMLPASIWVARTGYRTPTPVCRWNGKCVSLARYIGLLSGMSDCQYILPKNGDAFDCRLRNIAPMARVPSTYRAANKRHATGIKGIRPHANGKFKVVVREKIVGYAPTLNAAKKILSAHQRAQS